MTTRIREKAVDFASLSQPRRETIQWMLKVNAHYDFSPLTAALDRILLTFHFQKDKPWMIQLVDVTCISLDEGPSPVDSRHLNRPQTCSTRTNAIQKNDRSLCK